MKRKFYVTGGPLKITGEAGGGGGDNFPQKIDARETRLNRKILQAVAPKKKIHAAAGKKIMQISQLKKKKKQNSCTEKVAPPFRLFLLCTP